jgi:YVTN family beta-propeller protein
MLALSSSGDTLFAACWGGSTVAAIELSTKTDGYIPVGFQAHAPALVADSLLYVTCEGNHVNPYKVYVVNTITKTVVDSIDVGRYPNGIAVLRP